MKYALVIALVISAHLGFSQDKVELKDGSIVKGKIKEYVSNVSLKILNKDGDLVEYQFTEIEFVKFEKNIGQPKSKGYFGNMAVGALMGNNRWDDIGIGLSVQTIHGYMFNQKLQLGIGVGFETIDDEAYFPLFADLRYNLRKGSSVTPYVGLQAGYSFHDFERNDPDLYYPLSSYYRNQQEDGGIMAGLQFGVRNYTKKNLGYTFSIGYRYQMLSNQRNNYWHYIDYNPNALSYALPAYKETNHYHRIDIKFGLFFN